MIAMLHPHSEFNGAAEMPAAQAYHRAVLLRESVTLMEPRPGQVIVDCTLGGGGHSEAFLEAGAIVIGIDQDPEALDFASRRLARFAERFHPLRSNFSEAGDALRKLAPSGVDGAFLDIGVSSNQIDTPERGFSFQKDGPLDMRMNPDGPVKASDLVNTMSSEQLARIFKSLGEEPAARKIAERIVRDRAVRPFSTTLQLAETVEKVSPRRGKTHPATRVFQALRMAVNRELEALEQALEHFSGLLAPGGRLGVITFHSLEDRIVKTFLKERTAEFIDKPEWPAAKPNPLYLFKKLTGKAITASESELKTNPRARSAKLRGARKLQTSKLKS